MLNETAEKIFRMKYSREGKESWEEACWRVASHIASAEDTEENKRKYEEIFFKLIYNLVFIPGGRILANAGTGIDNLLNCFVLEIEDSRQGMYETLKDAAEIFAHGGGIGYDWSSVREEGAYIRSTGGSASGPISFMTLFDTTGDVIAQASRRGAQIACLSVDHPDIEKFILHKSTPDKKTTRLLDEYKRNLKKVGLNSDGHKYFKVLEKSLQDDQLSHFNVSALITDEFMQAVSKDEDWQLISRFNNEPVKTLKARELLSLIARNAWESGDPGLLFYDRANEDNMVKYMGDLKATNPCVTGDTRILTVYDGARTIKELAEEGKDILVYTWNSETKLPEVSKMHNIRKTRENSELIEITFDSGLKLKCTPDHNLYTFRGEKIQAKDIKEGQSIRAFSLSIHRDGHLRAHGFANNKVKHRYVARMVWEYYNGKVEGDNIIHHIDFDKLNNNIDNLELLSNSKHNSVHYPYRVDGGFSRRGRNHKVISIKYLEEKEDVYNGVVENTHAYIIADNGDNPLTGIVSANCGEIWLFSNEACCLGSLNLHAFYNKDTNSINFEFLEYAVRNAVRFLDNVQTKTNLPESLNDINTMNKGLRRLGLGVMGWADLLAELNLAYDSQDALDLASYLSWFISFFGWLESMQLAQEKGAFSFYDKNLVDLTVVERTLNSKFVPYKFNMQEVKQNGFRNVAITSIAPTGTIALLAGVNSGIEPFFALAYKRNITEGIGNTAKDYIIEINPILFDKLRELELSEKEIEEIKKEILKHGTLKNLEKIPEKLKAAFITSHEVSPFSHVDQQAAWQKYVHNSISKTINLNNDATEKDIEDIFIYAWNNNLKGITCYRDGSKSFQILNIDVKE